ncbi:MAG TPA: cytochrome P450 [Pyrinomonadaceae bacterium]|jgi:cytochrome P450
MASEQTHAPGLNPFAFFRRFPDFRDDPLNFMFDLVRQHGHVVRFRGAWVTHQITHPRDIERVLQTNAQNYHKGRTFKRLLPITGNGLLVSDGDFWRRQRRLAQPAFQRQRLDAYAPAMTAATEQMLARWQTFAARGESFDVAREMMRLTLHIIGLTMFGTDLTSEADAIARSQDVARAFSIRRLWQVVPTPMNWPTRRNREFRRAFQASERVILDMIAARRSGAVKSDDLLSRLVRATDEETGTGMTDEQLRAEAVTFLGAGHETTAVALAWLWYLLAQHEDAAAELQTELRRVLGGRAPTVEDLPQLPYTLRCIEETMRLYPPAWAMSRTALGPDTLGGYPVAPNSEVLIPTYVTHRHPDFWQEPDRFDPERFTPAAAAARPRYAYFPFGGGPRQCIGNNFALIEMQLVVASIAQRFRFRLVPGHRVVADPSITLRPRDGVWVTLHEI